MAYLTMWGLRSSEAGAEWGYTHMTTPDTVTHPASVNILFFKVHGIHKVYAQVGFRDTIEFCNDGLPQNNCFDFDNCYYTARRT